VVRFHSLSPPPLLSGQPWEARGIGIQELINATALALHSYSLLRAEGHDAPRAVIMIGLQNGPPANPSALGDESQWIHDNFWVPYGQAAFVSLPHDSLPLLVVLACGMSDAPNSSVTQTIGRGLFTIRYMSTQLQENPDLGLKKGFWSWMDGNAAVGFFINSDYTPLFMQLSSLHLRDIRFAQAQPAPFPPCARMARVRLSPSPPRTLLPVVGYSRRRSDRGGAAH
jgi:hypothetical protein